MDIETERMIEECKPEIEAIVYLRDGQVDRVETPDGKDVPEGERSPNIQAVVDMYQDPSCRVTARLYVYEDGGFGASIDN